LFKLPQGNTHLQNLPVVTPFQKEKRRAQARRFSMIKS